MIVMYRYIAWSPPKLSEEEEVRLGQIVATQGKQYFAEHFSKSINESGAKNYQRRKMNAFQWIFGVALPGGCLVFLAQIGELGKLLKQVAPALVVPIAFVLILYFGSVAIATFRYNRWLNRLVNRYAARAAMESAG